MKFSINTVLFVSPFTNSDTRLFAKFKKWGFDAVELLIEDSAHIDPVLVKRALRKNGLACGSVAAAINPQRDLRGTAASQRNGVKYLCQLIDQMMILDARVLGGLVYSYVGRARGLFFRRQKSSVAGGCEKSQNRNPICRRAGKDCLRRAVESIRNRFSQYD